MSWQPVKEVRVASVVVKYKNGFVLVARSLKEIELREDLTLKFAVIAWILGIGVTSLAFFLSGKFPKTSSKISSDASSEKPLKKAKK